MIDRLARVARLVRKWGWLCWLLAFAAAAMMAASVIPNPWLAGDRWLMLGVVALCWALALLSFGRLFESVPPPATAKMPWRERLGRRMKRGLLWLLGVAMIGLAGAIVLLSWQLLRVWMMS